VVVAALAAGVGAGTVLAVNHSSNTGSSSLALPNGGGSVPNPGNPDSGSSGGNPSSAVTQQVRKEVSPGIVDVISTPSYQNGMLEGTGMVLSSNGLVLTNNHVVEGTSKVVAKIANTGQEYSATVLGTDDKDDVALLKLNNVSGLKTIPIGNSSSVQVGQPVVALGNAEGQDGAPTVVSGKVTSLDQSIQATDEGAGTVENLTDMLETDAPIVSGDSGGALATTAGKVIGMNTAANSSTSASNPGASQGFAIPIDRALAIAHTIAAGKGSSTIQIGLPPFLGVTVASSKSGPSTSTSPHAQLQQLEQADQSAGGSSTGGLGGSGGTSNGCLSSDESSVPASIANVNSGALVAGVLCNTPVTQAGMTAGAVITSINGYAVTSPAALTSVLSHFHPAQNVTINWVDTGGKKHTSTVQLATGPAK
jgi:S1-C subfamily serine protease